MFGWAWWYSSFGTWEPGALHPTEREPYGDSTTMSRDLPLQASLGGELDGRTAQQVQPIEGLEFEPGEWNTKEDMRSDGSVLVEVLIQQEVDEETGEPSSSPGNFAWLDVHLQSWNEATDETHDHLATTDEYGIARFEFPGACHIDWIRSDFPAGSNSHAAFADPHEDVPAGAIVRFTLMAREPVRVVGRVTDTTGAPLANIPVWAMSGDVAKADKRIEDEWYPPTYETLSESDGTFEFAALPDEYLAIGVAPGEWLQLLPEKPGSADHPEWEEADPILRGRFASDPDVMVAETIVLVPREVIDLLVIDSNRDPVPFARLRIEPISLNVANLVGEESWDRRMDLAQTQWETDRVKALNVWSRDGLLKSGEDGTARFFGTPGTWRVYAGTRIESTDREFQLTVHRGNTAIHELRFPQKMASVSGRVIDGETGKPISGAKVRVYLEEDAETIKTDEDGEFDMGGLPVEGNFGVRLTHAKYFTREIDANLSEVPIEMTMRAASELDLQFLDHKGDPIYHQPVRLVRRNGDEDPTPLGAEGKEWLSLLPVPIKEINTTRNGQVNFGHLYPGTYDVELLMKTDTGRFGVWGEALAETKVWGRWSVKTSDVTTQLTVDLTKHSFTPTRGYVHFTGVVRSKNGFKQLAGAEVRVTCGDLTTSTFTSEGGAFAVDALAGIIQYEVLAPGYKAREGTLRQEYGGRKWMRFDLDPLD